MIMISVITYLKYTSKLRVHLFGPVHCVSRNRNGTAGRLATAPSQHLLYQRLVFKDRTNHTPRYWTESKDSGSEPLEVTPNPCIFYNPYIESFYTPCIRVESLFNPCNQQGSLSRVSPRVPRQSLHNTGCALPFDELESFPRRGPILQV